jgi:hypothetical protein
MKNINNSAYTDQRIDIIASSEGVTGDAPRQWVTKFVNAEFSEDR